MRTELKLSLAGFSFFRRKRSTKASQRLQTSVQKPIDNDPLYCKSINRLVKCPCRDIESFYRGYFQKVIVNTALLATEGGMYSEIFRKTLAETSTGSPVAATEFSRETSISKILHLLNINNINNINKNDIFQLELAK